MRVVSREYEKELNKKGEISGGHILPEDNSCESGSDEEIPDLSGKHIPIHEDRLAMATMSRKEKSAAIKQRYKEETKDMSRTERIKYFFFYYKWYFLTPAFIALFIGWVYIAVSHGARPIALSYAVINADNPDTVNTDFYDDYFSFYNFDNSYREISHLNNYIDYQNFKENESFYLSSDTSNYHTLSTNCDKGDYDIIITDRDGFQYCSYVGIVKPLTEYFDEETYKLLSKYEAEAVDFYGDTLPYGIDISGTEFAKNLNTGYDEVYIVFPGTTKANYDNAYNFVWYLFNNGILN